MRNYKNYNVGNIAEIAFNLIRAILYLHSMCIVHNDIKPENIVFPNSGIFSSLKLIDFGMSTEYYEDDPKNLSAESIQNFSPEMLQGMYNYKSDAWGVGLILYILVTGKHPFYDGEQKEDLVNKILSGEYNKDLIMSKNICLELKELIFNLLETDLDKRIELKDAIDHKFFELKSDYETYIDQDVFKSMENFSKKSYLQKELLFYLAKISDNDIKYPILKTSFEQFDINNTGFINYEDFNMVIKDNFKMDEKEIVSLWEGLDFRNEGKIKYTEFLASTMNNFKELKLEQIYMLFNYFDVNNKGYVTKLKTLLM